MRGSNAGFLIYRNFLYVCNTPKGASLQQIHRVVPLGWPSFRSLTRAMEDLNLIEPTKQVPGRQHRYLTDRPYNFKPTTKGLKFLETYKQLEDLTDQHVNA